MLSRRFSLAAASIGFALALCCDFSSGAGGAGTAQAFSKQQSFATVAQVEAAVTASRSITKLPASVASSLGNVSIDDDRDVTGVCFMADSDASASPLKECTYGNTKSTNTVVLFGDSLANMWFPAIQTLATDHGFKLVLISEANCPLPSITFYDQNVAAPQTACNTWRKDEIKAIKLLKPRRIYLASSGLGDEIAVNGRGTYNGVASAWTAGFVKTVDELKATGAKITMIGIPPYVSITAPNCLAVHSSNIQLCDASYAEAENQSNTVPEQAAAEKAGVPYVPVTELYCSPPRCTVVIHNTVVYRDPDHTTATYVKYLTGALGTLLQWPATSSSAS
jgi:hypothetical protein